MALPLHRTKIVATIGPASSSRDAESEAVALANDSEYGLATSVWTRDVDRPLRIARELQVGTVWVNDWVTMRDEFEEGGYKQSGEGVCAVSRRPRTSWSTSTSYCNGGPHLGADDRRPRRPVRYDALPRD